MAVEVSRRVAGFKEEQAWRVMEESWRKKTKVTRSSKGKGFLSPYMSGVPPGDGRR
jgi:hypothetical protein